MNLSAPDARCPRCRGWLFPPKLAPPNVHVPASADYVCLFCRSTFYLGGNPPVLRMLVLPPPDDDDNSDE